MSSLTNEVPNKQAVGKVQLCQETHSLIINNKTHKLRNKLFRLFKYFAEHPNSLVERQQLIEKIWDGNYYIGEKGLTHAICILRSLLKKYPDCGVSIETVPKSGYLLRVRGRPVSSNQPTNTNPGDAIDTSIPDWWPKNDGASHFRTH